MIVLLEQGAGLGLRRVGPWQRMRARMRATALDRMLAAGVSPESDVALALHAARVYGPPQRRLLARSLVRIAEASQNPSRRLAVPYGREAVHQVRAELAEVADRLGRDGPVSVHGVARVRLLLSDGSGPLYRATEPDQLLQELRSALVALDSAA